MHYRRILMAAAALLTAAVLAGCTSPLLAPSPEPAPPSVDPEAQRFSGTLDPTRAEGRHTFAIAAGHSWLTVQVYLDPLQQGIGDATELVLAVEGPGIEPREGRGPEGVGIDVGMPREGTWTATVTYTGPVVRYAGCWRALGSEGPTVPEPDPFCQSVPS